MPDLNLTVQEFPINHCIWVNGVELTDVRRYYHLGMWLNYTMAPCTLPYRQARNQSCALPGQQRKFHIAHPFASNKRKMGRFSGS